MRFLRFLLWNLIQSLKSNAILRSVVEDWRVLSLPEFGAPFTYFLGSFDLFAHVSTSLRDRIS